MRAVLTDLWDNERRVSSLQIPFNGDLTMSQAVGNSP
jgi:hypothetical protein